MEIVFSIHLLIVKQSISVRLLMRPVAIGSHSGRHRVRVNFVVIIIIHVPIIANCRVCLIILTFQVQITKLLIGQSTCMSGIINKFFILHRKYIICQVIIVLDGLAAAFYFIERIPFVCMYIPKSFITSIYHASIMDLSYKTTCLFCIFNYTQRMTIFNTGTIIIYFSCKSACISTCINYHVRITIFYQKFLLCISNKTRNTILSINCSDHVAISNALIPILSSDLFLDKTCNILRTFGPSRCNTNRDIIISSIRISIRSII